MSEQRIKVTGYMVVDNLNASDVDLNDRMGLTSEGYENAVGIGGDMPWTLGDLEDVDFELTDE